MTLSAPREKRPRVRVTRHWPEAVIRALGQRFEVVVDDADRPLTREALASAMRELDALCSTVTDRVDASLFELPERRVRIVAQYGVGVDGIDLDAARVAGVVVTNTPDVLTEATAELALLLMLTVARRTSEGERVLRAGQWSGWAPTQLLGRELRTMRLGLVGFGRIGQALARLAHRAMGMEVSWFSPRAREVPTDLGFALFEPSLEALLRESDVVSLHCPGGEATRHLIDEKRLAQMRRGAILINTARGTVVDEEALGRALAQRHLGGAGLDVYEREPAVSPALLALPNVVLVPHLGSATEETRVAMGMRVLANLEAFFDGKEPPDRVA